MKASFPRILVVSFLLALVAAPGLAQTGGGSDALSRLPEGFAIDPARDSSASLPVSLIAQSGSVDAAEYVLGPGDVLLLRLWGRVDRTTMLPVDPEGLLFLPNVGPVTAAGQTLQALRARLQERVQRELIGVKVGIELARVRRLAISVTGSVANPGIQEVTAATRASELASVIRLAPDASRRNLELRRADGSRIRIDLGLLQYAGRHGENPYLREGDVLHVPVASRFVNANGAFGRPGRYEWAAGDSVSDLVDLAGGMLPSAGEEKVLLIRFRSPTDRESIWVDSHRLEHGPESPLLQDGDQIFAGFLPDYHVLPSVGIYGEVVHPGSFPIVLGRDRLSDLVRWSGGFLPRANRSSLHLLRATPGTETDPAFDRLSRLARSEMTEAEFASLQTKLLQQRNAFLLDWERIEAHDGLDPLLQPDDLVRVDPQVLTVRVEGEVMRPGFVDFSPKNRIDDYIYRAGGFSPRAARRSVRVSRSVTGQVVLARNLRSSDIKPGDYIWVPEKRDVDFWPLARDILTVGGQLAVIIFTVTR